METAARYVFRKTTRLLYLGGLRALVVTRSAETWFNFDSLSVAGVAYVIGWIALWGLVAWMVARAFGALYTLCSRVQTGFHHLDTSIV
jgi:hypothetical protein